MKLRIAILALALAAPALADDPLDGRGELDEGREAYAHQQFAARTAGDAALLLECLRLRAAVQRDSGDAAHAGESLAAAAEAATKAYGENSPELAGVLEEIATGQRAQGHAGPALAAIEKAKMDDAADLYHRTAQIGELAQAPDDVMDPPLRIYATVLRHMQRDDEAAVVEKRVKDALLRKADREGPRPAPVPAPAPPQ